MRNQRGRQPVLADVIFSDHPILNASFGKKALSGQGFGKNNWRFSETLRLDLFHDSSPIDQDYGKVWCVMPQLACVDIRDAVLTAVDPSNSGVLFELEQASVFITTISSNPISALSRLKGILTSLSFVPKRGVGGDNCLALTCASANACDFRPPCYARQPDLVFFSYRCQRHAVHIIGYCAASYLRGDARYIDRPPLLSDQLPGRVSGAPPRQPGAPLHINA